MNLSEAKDFARNKTLKATALLLLVLVLLVLLVETKGDFANGVLFFLQAIINIHTLAILIITFSLTIVFAGLAGKEIIIKRQNAILISVKYVLLLSFVICLYALLLFTFRQGDFRITAITASLKIFIFPLFFKIFVSLLIVWLWATYQMKSVEGETH